MIKVSAWICACFILVAGFSTVSFAADAAKPEEVKVVAVGDKVPDLKLPGIDGKEISFDKDILGKHEVTFITFMTTACSACQAEVAAVSDIVSKYKEKVGLYAIAVDIRGAEPVKQYVATYKYNATYLLDPKFTTPRLFGFSYTPSVILADKAGKVLYMKGGYGPGDDEMLAEKVVEIVKKK